MAFVVTSACIGCKHADCVQVCPADCFHQDEQMLYIDPDQCTECGACESECPEEAIFHDTMVPDDETRWIEINASRSQVCPSITP